MARRRDCRRRRGWRSRRRELRTFFFQAEDGIRDGTVTGVQTCALPISPTARACPATSMAPACVVPEIATILTPGHRSEERRVGKECRARWSPDHQKKEASATVELEIRNGWLVAVIADAVVGGALAGGSSGLFFFKQKTAYEMEL